MRFNRHHADIGVPGARLAAVLDAAGLAAALDARSRGLAGTRSAGYHDTAGEAIGHA